MDFDQILPHIYGRGRYQVFLYCIISIPTNLICSFILSSFIYVSAIPKHWCRVPELEKTNMTLEDRILWSIPYQIEEGKLIPSSCQMYNINYTWLIDNFNKSIVINRDWPKSACKYGWNYDKSFYYRTLVTEMNIVCESKYLTVIANTGFLVGNMVGPIIFGHFSDKYGRKRCLLYMIIISVMVGIMACFPPNYISYIVYRSFMGLTSISTYAVSLVLALELMMPEKREMYGLLYAIIFSIGLVAFSGISYALRDWFFISIISSFPFVLLIFYWWVVPESPRWLLSQNQINEAEAIVQKIAQKNDVTIKENFLFLQLQEYKKKNPRKHVSETVIKSPHLELMIHPNMRLHLLILTYDMIVVSVMYNGLLFGSNLMQLNDYLSTAVLSFSEIPGIALAWIITVKLGRKLSLFLTMGIGGVACLCIIFVPLDYVLTIFILSNIGKAGVTGAYAMIFLYGSELFPTPLRSSALLIASLFASLVTIGVPYFLLLAHYHRTLPLIIMGALSIMGSFVVMYLPETRNIHLPQTMEEGEALGAENKCCQFGFCKKINTIVLST